MSKSDVFHLGLTKNDLQGATLAIVPGDPERVEKIAALMDKPVKLASHREFTSWRAELDGKPVIVCSTGIGGPSTSIAVEELAQLGAYLPAYRHHRCDSTAHQRWRCVGDYRLRSSGRRQPALRADGIPGRRRLRLHHRAGGSGEINRRHHPYRRNRFLGYLLPGPGALRHLLRPRREPLQGLNGRVAGNGRDEL